MKTKLLWILLFSLVLVPFVNASYIVDYDEYVDGNSFCSVYNINYEFDYLQLQYLENGGIVQLNDPDQSSFLSFNPIGSIYPYSSMSCGGLTITPTSITIYTQHNQYWWPEMSTLGGTIGGIYMMASGQNYTVKQYEKNLTYSGSDLNPIYFNEAGGPFPGGASFHHGDTATAVICINFNQSVDAYKDVIFDFNCRGTFVPFITRLDFPKKVGAKVCTEQVYNELVNVTQDMSESQAGIVESLGSFSGNIYEVWLIFYWIVRIGILVGVIFGVVYLIFWTYNYVKKVIG